MTAILFLYNCSAHTIYDEEKYKLPKRIFVFFLPLNVTNTHQPADVGTISSIKVGYKVTLLDQLLPIFDIEGRYIRAYAKRKNQNRGCKVIDFGGNPHLLDSTRILKPIWEDYEGKCVGVDGIKRLW